MRRKLFAGLGRVAEYIPAALAWAGLAGLFVYGTTHGWKFVDSAEKEKAEAKPEAAPEEDDGPAFEPRYVPQPSGVPVLMTHDPAHCKNFTRPVRFKSSEAEAKAGIVARPAGKQEVSTTVTAPGGVLQTPTAVAEVATPVAGVVAAFDKKLGDKVTKGELIALIDSADVGHAKAALRSGRVGLRSAQTALTAAEERMDILNRSNPTAEQLRAARAELEQARIGLDRARISLDAARQTLVNYRLPLPTDEDEALPDADYAARLQLLGIPPARQQEIYAEARRTGRPLTANLLPILSPLDGVVMSPVTALLGQPVMTKQLLLEIGDPTRVDVFLNVRLEDLPMVKPGQPVSFKAEGAAEPVAGEVTLNDPKGIDQVTRTQKVWVGNLRPAGVLRSGAFGTGTVTVEKEHEAVVVPRTAVHWEGCSFLVFVREVARGEDGAEEVQYRPRRVTVGPTHGDVIEIRDGLKEGEPVAVSGSHVLKNELLKDRIGEAEE